MSTGAIDQHLLDLIDQHAPAYYNPAWKLNLEQFKAWVATIGRAEGGYGGYGAHSQYGGGVNGDAFTHTANASFRFSTGIGPFQLDNGGADSWQYWATIDKLDPEKAVKSTMKQHQVQFPAGATLADFSASSRWAAVNTPSKAAAQWAVVTDTNWDAHKSGKAQLDWVTIRSDLAANASDAMFRYESNVQAVGSMFWSIDADDHLVTDSGKNIFFNGSFETWLITARRWLGTEVCRYYYTRDVDTGIEVWVLDNAGVSQNLFGYVFTRGYAAPSGGKWLDHRASPGDVLASPAFDAGIIHGTAGDDVVRLVCNPSAPALVDVFINNPGTSPTFLRPRAAITQWQIAGGEGNDELVVDFSRGSPVAVGGLAYDGGTHATADRLVIRGTAGNDIVTVTGAHVLFADAPAMSCSNVECFAFDLGTGADTVTLSGAAVRIDRADAISDGSSLTVTSGAVLDLGGRTETVDAVTVLNGAVANGTLIGSSYTVQSGTISAALAGACGVSKTGSGTVTLSRSNAYAGGTLVSAGTLQVAGADALPRGRGLTVGAGGTVVLASGLGVQSAAPASGASSPAALPGVAGQAPRQARTGGALGEKGESPGQTRAAPGAGETPAPQGRSPLRARQTATAHDAVLQAAHRRTFWIELSWLWEAEQAGFANRSKTKAGTAANAVLGERREVQ